MNHKRKLSLVAAAALCLSLLGGCAPKEPVESAAPSAPPSAAPTVEAAPAAGADVSVGMLAGPTGLGAAKLMADNVAGTTANSYTFQLAAAPTDLMPKLSNGDLDIAALPTNVASTLYHKTEGGVELLALNTRGVLYILEKGDTISTMADLKGKTIYAPSNAKGANPEYVLNYLLRQNGVDPAADVTVEWKTSEEIAAAMGSGEATVCMLPVPASTALLIQDQDVREALDLSKVWEESAGDDAGALTMGCVVARTDFVKEHPEAVTAFLTEYSDSIRYMADPANLDAAAALAEQYSIVPKAAVAKKALPSAHLCFVTGEDMMADIQGYYQILFAADPASIGGSIPDGAFYYTDGSFESFDS